MNDASFKRLQTAHQDLIDIFTVVDEYIPTRITEAHRGQVAQDLAFEQGKTKVKWPNSKHNKTPSEAVDAIPEPVDYKDTKRLHFYAGFVMGIAVMLKKPLRWGGDWDGDTILGEPNDDWDKPHFERKTKK